VRGSSVREKRFKTTVGSDESAILLSIPFDLKRVFGKVRLPLKVTVNDYSYRTTVTVYKHRSFFPMLREHREAANVKAGETVDVVIALDSAVPPRNPASRPPAT
jgi:hypothetical protein